VSLRGNNLDIEGGNNIIDGINRLRYLLRDKKAVRLVGLSGVGKTRLVQALFDARIGETALDPNLAIYADISDEPNPIPQDLLQQLQGLHQPSVLIVDNCGIELHRKLSSRQKLSNEPIAILTIEYDLSDDEPENTDVFKLEAASSEVIGNVIRRRYPNISPVDVQTITSFSEGNFRIALALAETAQDGESLANMKDSDLFKRLFRQRNDDNPNLLRAASVCSLVYSFSVEATEGEAAELPSLARLADQSVAEIHAHVAELYRRNLVQKRSRWRAVLPHALAHKLAKQAMQDIPRETILSTFKNEGSERLLKSFSKRLGCLHDSQAAREIVADWLKDGGWLSEVENYNELGLTLLTNIAPVDPLGVLECIEQAVKRGRKIFEGSHTHQRDLINLLRSLAYTPEFFSRTVYILAEFTKDGSSSNNSGDAINVFKSLFPLYLSGTLAGPELRAKVIWGLAQTGDPRDIVLASVALESILECDHFSSAYNFEFGTRKRDYGYWPRSSEDIRAWYRNAFELCRSLDSLDHMRAGVRSVVASRFKTLAIRVGVINELLPLADFYAETGGWAEGWIGARAAFRRLADTERTEDRQRLAALTERLNPRSLGDRIASYVTPKSWSPLDVADVDIENEANWREAEKDAERICADIGAALASDLATLAEHLPALAVSESYRLVTVLSTVGQTVKDIPAAWQLVRAASLAAKGKGSYEIAPLFMNGAAIQNREAIEPLLDEALNDPDMHYCFVTVQTRAGLNEQGVARIIQAAALPTIPTNTFRNLAYGSPWVGVSDRDMRRILGAIASRADGLSIVLEVLDQRVYCIKSEGGGIGPEVSGAARDLLSQLAFDGRGPEANNQSHRLGHLIENCLHAGADDELARSILRSLLAALIDHRVYATNFKALIGALAMKFPRPVLDELIEGAANSDQGGWLLGSTRSERLDPAGKLDPGMIFEWAAEMPDSRFPIVARVVPLWERIDGASEDDTDLDGLKGPLRWTQAAERLFRDAPDPAPVLGAYFDRFTPSGWSGSLTAILEERRPLIEMLQNDPDPRVRAWAAKAIPSFDEQIARTRKWENTEARARDERFEW
jgi:hypothetical protein